MRAQAASEFLVTYGFGLLIVIGAIAVLASSIVPNIIKVPDQCTTEPGMDCIGKPIIYQDNIIFSVKNSFEKQSLVQVLIDECAEVSAAAGKDNNVYSLLPVNVSKNQVLKIKMNCSFSKNKISKDMNLVFYNLKSGIDNQVSGKIKGTVI